MFFANAWGIVLWGVFLLYGSYAGEDLTATYRAVANVSQTAVMSGVVTDRLRSTPTLDLSYSVVIVPSSLVYDPWSRRYTMEGTIYGIGYDQVSNRTFRLGGSLMAISGQVPWIRVWYIRLHLMSVPSDPVPELSIVLYFQPV